MNKWSANHQAVTLTSRRSNRRKFASNSPRAFRAWPSAWPSPSGPLGRPRSPGSTARRRRVPRSGMRSTVEAGGADPDNARRSGLMAVTSSRLPAHPARGRRPGRGAGRRGSGIRRGPQAAGHRGRPCAAARRAVGLASEGRGGSCRPATARPRVKPSRLRRSPGRSSPSTARAYPRCSRPGRQAWRAEGAPLKL